MKKNLLLSQQMEKKVTVDQKSQIEELKNIIEFQKNVDYTRLIFEEQSKGISEVLDGIRATIITSDTNPIDDLQNNLDFCQNIKDVTKFSEIQCKKYSDKHIK